MRGSLSWLLAAALCAPATAHASESVRHVVLVAELTCRTSVRVSTQTLVFSVAEDGGAAIASVEYSAAARTRADGEVLVSFEWPREVEGPGGAADVEASLTLEGNGSQLGANSPTGAAPASSGSFTAGRWIGSGVRHGRLTFRLTAAVAGVYTVPVRLGISAP
jgi:hypothetical protein